MCNGKNILVSWSYVIIPFGDIDEIRRSQHAVINPAITIVLRLGAGGHGAPPLRSPDGRVRYMFASFWNRNHAVRTLQRSAKNYHSMIEAEKKEEQQSELRASSSSLNRKKTVKVLEESVPSKHQPFIHEDVLTEIYNVIDPTHHEEAVMGGSMTAILNTNGDFCAIQKAGGEGVLQSVIMQCLRIASVKADDITTKIKTAGVSGFLIFSKWNRITQKEH